MDTVLLTNIKYARDPVAVTAIVFPCHGNALAGASMVSGLEGFRFRMTYQVVIVDDALILSVLLPGRNGVASRDERRCPSAINESPGDGS